MRSLRNLTLAFGLAVFPATLSPPSAAEGPRTAARQAFMIALPSRRVLLEKQADRPMAPSSMVKLMTVLVVLEAVRAGRLAMDGKIEISRRAVDTRGARIGLAPGDRVPLETLLRGTIVASGNDSAIALAEAVAGSEAAFARRMTERAKTLGLKASSFRNATGFTVRGQRMSARDVATLSARLIEDFPLLYAYFGLEAMRYGKTTFRNRNPVLGVVRGADGLKTGQTYAGGYGLAASAQRGGVRLILVMNGLKSTKARRNEAIRLLEWGFKRMATGR
jgi:D-alanyl-D-alanine carboxypeptidase (penicillin-binding protein 5/6)